MARIGNSFASRRAARLALVALCALALVQCGEQGRFGGVGPGGGGGGGGTGGGPEVNAPTVQILQPATANLPVGIGDSVFVQARATDDNGVVKVEFFGVAIRGDVSLGTDQIVTRFTPKTVNLPVRMGDTTLTRYLLAASGDSTSELVQLIVVATDSSGKAGADTAQIRITSGPRIRMPRPTNGSFTSPGKSITIEVTAVDPQGVRVVGWRATGVLTAADSLIQAGAGGVLPDSVTFIDTLTIPASSALGDLNLTPFAVDSIGDPSGTQTATVVTIQSAASDVTAPLVTFTVTKRVEVDDSITVNATDPSGITRIGFIVRQFGSTTVVAADSSAALSGQQTDVTQSFALKLDTVTTFPRLVTVEAFAIDAAANRGLSSRSGTPVPSTLTAASDTLTVVAGKTFALPAGGELADAVYNRNREEIYFSNITRDRIEVFDVLTSTFLAGGIPVGSRPWGLALWPRDTLGAYGDTLIVANSGGTNLSIVDLTTAARREIRRHRLPNYLIQTVKTEFDQNTSNLVLNIVEYDFADRPQFVAATCRANCGDVFAVFSTAPTAGQATTFAGRGYVAWEELTATSAAPNGHFFWEQATGSANPGNDTLQIISVRDSIPGVPRRDTILGAGVGVMVQLRSIAFDDSTFVRSSGNFNHAIIGEGGLADFARAMTWDARADTATINGSAGCSTLLGYALKCTGIQDFGIAEGIQVRDFLVNRSSPVTSVATNFNGLTNFVRADSIYVFDLTLRLTGLLQVGGLHAGMDVHPNHAYDARSRGTGGVLPGPSDRLMFAARPDANIEVFDTYFFGSVAILPVRDTIIGQLRLAQTATGQVLIGVTTRGIVVVPLVTPIANPFPVRETSSPLRARRGG